MATESPERRPRLSLIIPAYNEHQGIEAAVRTSLETLRSSGIAFEVVVVDDGSTDGTAGILDRCFSGEREVRVHHQKPNTGFGGALRKGIGLAALDHILFAPVDNPLTPEVLAPFLEHFGEADVLVSYRVERVGYSPRMKVFSRLYETIVSAFFGLRLRDFNWLHLYPRSVFGPGGVVIESDGIFSLAEILIRCHRRGCTFREFPVRMRGRDYGVKTSATFRALWRTAWEFWKFYFRHLSRPAQPGQDDKEGR